jgi:hypothetical protein
VATQTTQRQQTREGARQSNWQTRRQDQSHESRPPRLPADSISP